MQNFGPLNRSKLFGKFYGYVSTR